jgi:hypothetical protein
MIMESQKINDDGLERGEIVILKCLQLCQDLTEKGFMEGNSPLTENGANIDLSGVELTNQELEWGAMALKKLGIVK